MNKASELHVLWTNDDVVTAEKMVFMYTVNSVKNGWWDRVTLIIWGATARLAGEHAGIRSLIRQALEAGVHVTACKACADQLGVTGALEGLGVVVKYWGTPLTEILQAGKPLLTV